MGSAHLNPLTIVLASLVVTATAGTAAPDRTLIAREGKDVCLVAVAADATPPEQPAAQELAVYLGQATGADFSLGEPTGASGKPLITVGPGAAKALAPGSQAWAAEADARYGAVRGLRPVGYWPADEGAGEVLHDRSATGNHGALCNVPWREGLLDFTPFTYQWVHVAHRPVYASAQFSLGGWVFCRSAYKESRVLLIGQPLEPGTDAWRWTGFGGAVPASGVLLYLRAPAEENGQVLVGVAGGGKEDAIGSIANGTAITTQSWNHILYAHDAEGVGRLYVNGRLAHTAESVPYQGADTPFALGSDLRQWQPYQPNGRSVDGCVRDLVLFDRALSPDEVKRLRRATQPAAQPVAVDPEALLRDPQGISLDSLKAGPPAARRRAWETLAGGDPAGSEWFAGDLLTAEEEAQWPLRLRTTAAALMPLMPAALAHAETRLPAPRVLVALDTEASREVLSGAGMLLVANLLGVWLGEWRAAPPSAHRWLWAGLLTLVVAVIVLAARTA